MPEFHRRITRSKPDEAAFAPERLKLAEVKEEWAKSDRLIDSSAKASSPHARRLPPGQSQSKDMPVLDLGRKPLIARDDWHLAVTGMVLRPRVLDFDDMEGLGPVETFNDIHCVTGWSRFDVAWRGVPLPTILKAAEPLPKASHAILKGDDGYRTCLPLTDLDRPDILIAFALDGAPLPRDHGGPARLVIPHLYFWKSVKWVKAIHLTDSYAAGTWEARGYHPRGDPWKQERYR